MSALFSGNSSQLKARLDTLETRYVRDINALTHRVYNAEVEIHGLRALTASFSDMIEEFRRRIVDLEICKNEVEQPQRDNIHPNSVPNPRSPTSPIREPQPEHVALLPPFLYRPNRQPSRASMTFTSHRPNNVVTTPETNQEIVSVRSGIAPNQTMNATDTPPLDAESTTKSLRTDAASPPVASIRSGDGAIPRPDQISISSETQMHRRTWTTGKTIISIDFKTDYIAAAYGTHLYGGRVRQILAWQGSSGDVRRIPTCLVYDDQGNPLLWGLVAQNESENSGFPGKDLVGVVVDLLFCLREYIVQQITREIGVVIDLADWADLWLVLPTFWSSRTRDLISDAAVQAGLVCKNPSSSRNVDDQLWKDRLKVISGAEASSAHSVYLTDLQRLRSSQSFMVCDVGMNIVSLTVYKVLGSIKMMEIGEVCMRTRTSCGGNSLNARFESLVIRLLERHPTHTDHGALAYFQLTFDETVKPTYRGEDDDCTTFQFNCFNAEDSHDPLVGLINGELHIPGVLLRTEVFEPVFDELLWLIGSHLAKSGRDIDALLLVGEFSCSEYLLTRINKHFGPRIGIIARPPDADTAACRGAARYGLHNGNLTSSYIVPKSYIMKVQLPAEPEDLRMRAGYVFEESNGRRICNNRLQYLLQKGAILKRRQVVKSKLFRFSKTIEDSTFEILLCTSDSDHMMRYTDEGETSELRKWTINLFSIPKLREYVRMNDQKEFCIEFELGLELDSTEVRGILVHDGVELDRAVLDSLNI